MAGDIYDRIAVLMADLSAEHAAHARLVEERAKLIAALDAVIPCWDRIYSVTCSPRNRFKEYDEFEGMEFQQVQAARALLSALRTAAPDGSADHPGGGVMW